MPTDRKEHWETVYTNKQPHEVSWTQAVPQTSLNFIESLQLAKTAKIIDIGSGDSKLVDHLLAEGYENITVLDISARALERAKQRLGKKADKVQWVVSDVLDFNPSEQYDVWHDRAVLHFLTTAEQTEQYAALVSQAVKNYMVIGTFSENGPKKCSGLDIKQYSEESMSQQFAANFEQLQCTIEDHTTPFDTVQNFIFCGFKRKT